MCLCYVIMYHFLKLRLKKGYVPYFSNKDITCHGERAHPPGNGLTIQAMLQSADMFRGLDVTIVAFDAKTE